jgi:hypothetical protein
MITAVLIARFSTHTGTTAMPLRAGVAAGLLSHLRDYATSAGGAAFNLVDASVQLYHGLSVTAEGSEKSVIYHANPEIDHAPWYDDLVFQAWVGEKEVLVAGSAEVFVDISVPGNAFFNQEYVEAGGECNFHLVLVHSYRARSLQNGQPIWDLFHPRSLYAANTNPNCKNIPMPLMVHAYEPRNRTKPVFDLFPTSAISSGVWTQDDFRDTAAHPFKWFLYGPPPRGFFRNSGDLYVD